MPAKVNALLYVLETYTEPSAADAVRRAFSSAASETGSNDAVQVSIEVSPSDEVALYFPDTPKTVSEQVMADRHVIPHASVAMSVCSLVF